MSCCTGWRIHLWQMPCWLLEWKYASSYLEAEKIAQPRTPLCSTTGATQRPPTFCLQIGELVMSDAPSPPSSHIIQQQLTFKWICLSCGFHSLPCFCTIAPIASHCSCSRWGVSIQSSGLCPKCNVHHIHRLTEIAKHSMNGLSALVIGVGVATRFSVLHFFRIKRGGIQV